MIRLREIGVIQNIKELRPQLRIQALGDWCVLGNGKVQVLISGAVYGIASEIARRSVGLAKCEWIEISRGRHPVRHDGIDASHNVRPLVVVGIVRVECIGGSVDRNGPAGLQAAFREPVQPACQNPARSAGAH
jgi:hypothetical protein